MGELVKCPHCKASISMIPTVPVPASERDPLLGAALGGCQILERIGKGAMAIVYRAEQLKLRRTVALKVMLPGLLAHDEAYAERFMSEARLAAQLEHPHIVQVYDVGEERSYYYIVMQFIRGETLRDLIRRKGRLAPGEAIGFLLQAARGLGAAHQRGLIHRDIKPSNLLVSSEGVVRISDFGLAKALSDTSQLTHAQHILGTPCYMSPEQCRGERLDPRSDLYSLGVTLFEMLMGKPPYEGETPFELVRKHVHEPVPQELQADSTIPRPVVALVERMMAKDPDKRCPSAEELIREIERIPDEGASLTERAPALDDRQSFRTPEAVLAVVRQRCRQFRDEDAVWEAFIAWRGRGEREYLQRIRAGGMFIFYALLQDLYCFAEEACGEDVGRAVGGALTEAVLARHMPDILQSILGRGGSLPDQVHWLIQQVVAATTGTVYTLSVERPSDESQLRMALSYRSEQEMAEYLARSGHDPERAFARSFAVFAGALEALLARVVYGFRSEQFQGELRPLHGTFRLHLRSENRFHHENLVEILLECVRRLRERREPEARPAAPDADVHASRAMKAAWERVRKAAATDETLLLCGESGTGKSYYAQVVHDLSARRDGPFVEVGLTSEVGTDNLIQSNLFGHVRGAFTGADEEKQGLFALADGGTIFLDEIGDATPELQAKLLRVIEKKTFKMLGGVRDLSVNVRIIAATNKNLTEMMRQGRFREDLFYRLNVICVQLPPLRERPEDIPALVQRLFERVCRESGKAEKHLCEDTFSALCSHSWPGNIRELENALRHAVALSEDLAVGPQDLPEALRNVPVTPGLPTRAAAAGNVIDGDALRHAIASARRPLEARDFEWQGHIDYAKREYLKALITHYRGNLAEIARHWDKSSENTLLKLIRELGLEEHLHAARRARK
jgi:DNA-binding NtrC family response regulator/tRNA A-37 threonylcarbamoyl transferase component Bud32